MRLHQGAGAAGEDADDAGRDAGGAGGLVRFCVAVPGEGRRDPAGVRAAGPGRGSCPDCEQGTRNRTRHSQHLRIQESRGKRVRPHIGLDPVETHRTRKHGGWLPPRKSPLNKHYSRATILTYVRTYLYISKVE